MSRKFNFTRRIPEIFRPGVSDEALSKLEAHTSGLTLFRRFDMSDPNDYQLLSDVVRAVVSLDRKNQHSAFNALKREGVWQLMQPILAARPEHAFAPDFVDLWNLYSFIRVRRPRRVLEFGSGLSTLVMAYALSRNGNGHLHSVEPLEQWETETRKMLPAELVPFCDVRYSPAAAHEVAGVKTARFAEVPDVAPDFTYLDGAPKGSVFEGAEEIHLLEEKLSPGAAVIIDGRFRALHFFLDGHLKRDWQVWTQTVAVEYPRLGTCVPSGLDQFSNSMCMLQR